MAASTNSDKLKQVYDLYVSKGLIQKTDFNTFSKATDDQKKKLYDLGTKEGLFKTTDYNTFSTAWVKKKEQGAPRQATGGVSGTGSVPTQPTSGSKPSQGRFISAGGTVSEADKQALLKFASKPFDEQRGTGERASYKSIEERTKQIRDEQAAAQVRSGKGNVLEQKPTEEKGPTLMSEEEYKAKVERERARYEAEVQGVMSYLKTSSKNILFDNDALNEDVEYLKKDRGYSDQVIMEGVDRYKKLLQQKRSDDYLKNEYNTIAKEMGLRADLPEERLKEITEGRVFSKALQFGVETMSADERNAYVMLGELRDVTEKLNNDPGNNSLIVKSADLKQKIGNLLDNQKMLFDPVTGQLVDKPNENTEKYQAEVNAEAAKLKSETAEDKLAKNYVNRYATFKYWDQLYDNNQRRLVMTGESMSPDQSMLNKQIRDARTVRDNWVKAKKEFDVAKISYLLNRDPAGVPRDYGVKAAAQVFAETITPTFVQDALPEGMIGLTDKTYLELVQQQLPEAGLPITKAQEERFKKTLTEEVVEGAGGLAGILPKLWLAGRVIQAGSYLTTLDDIILNMRNGNAFEKSFSFLLRGGLEEGKTQLAGFAPGVGIGFQAAGETIRLPRLKGKFGVILQPALDAAVAGSVGGTVGMELGEVIAKTVDVLGTNQDWNEKMEELFPDFDTVERRIVTNLILNGLFGLAHMPKGSLTFSPEKLMEMSKKMEAKGMRQEADFLAKRAAELSGYQKVDMQIAKGATGVAGRRAEQEQRPVVAEPKAPAPAPAAPAPKAEEAAPAPAPAPAPKPVTEAKPKEKSPITVAQSIESGRVYDRDGEKGVLKQEGQIVVLEKSNGDVIELGNIDQVKDQSISDFNIKETTDIKLNDDNSFEVDGKTYVNNYSTPDSAISVDKDGNYSVTLDTPEGKKRTFRGDRGEEMAYQIRLKQLENAKNEQSIDRAIELADEAIAAEGKTGEIATTQEARDIEQVITESGRKAESIEDAKAAFSEGKDVYVMDEMTGEPYRVENVTELDVYNPDQISIIEAKPEAVKEGETVKPETDAVQVKTAGEVPVQPEAGVGEKVEKRKSKAKPEKVAQKGVEEEVAPKEPVVETKVEEPATMEVDTNAWGEPNLPLLTQLGLTFKMKDKSEMDSGLWESPVRLTGPAKPIDVFNVGDYVADTNNGKIYKIVSSSVESGEAYTYAARKSDKIELFKLKNVLTGATDYASTNPDATIQILTGDRWQRVKNTEPLKGVEVKSTEEPVTTAKKPAAKTKPWKPTGTTKETVDIKALKKEVNENGRPLSEFKDGDIVIWASKANDAFDAYVEGTVSRKDGEVILIRFKENPVSKEYKYTYLSENTKVIPKPEGDPVYIGPEHFKRNKPSPKTEKPAAKTKVEEPVTTGEKPAAKGEFWTNEKAFSVQPKVGDIVDFDGKKHEVLQKTKVGKEQKYLLKEQPKAEEPAPKAEEAGPDAATFLNEKLGLGKSRKPKAKEPAPKVEEPAAKVEEPVAKTTEQKIEEAQKFVDDAAAWLKEKLKIDTLPPDTKAMGITSDALIDVAADAVKKLVATGIKTADAIKQVVDALREGGFLKDIDEKSFAGRLETGKPTGGITWQKVVPGRGDKNISARNPVVTQAAKELLNGRITNEQYRDIVEQNAAIGPITRFFEPATEQQVKDALTKEKVKNANKPIENGAKVGLRVDIPAFTDNNVWVVSVHEGHSKKSPVLSYTSVAMINNVSFGAAPNETIKMAAGSYKDAVQKMYGEWVDIPGKTLAEKAEYAKKMVEDIVNSNNPEWVQVGVNPFRHSFFYDRNRDLGRPLISADQAIQIGGLVYAKNPVYGKWTDAAYRVKGLLDAAGKEVRFSKRTGEPEGAKPVDIKEKEIIEEMNSMDLVNKGVSIEAKSTTDKKINTEELNSSLDTPLEVVDFKNYEGIPFIFTISDQLRTGDTVNPFTGEVISDLKGGLGFNGTKGNENAAWANTTAAEGNATVERAMYVYNKNKALFDRLWKEGRLPDGHIPMAVVKMGETSILSNEAVFRVGIQNIQTLPMSNRNKATVVLKQTLKGKIAETKRLIAKGADPKTGEEYSENTMNSKKKQLAQYENILDILNQNKYKDIVDVLKDNKNFSLPEKAIIINQVFYGVPTTIGGKPIDINRSKAKTPVSKALIGNKNPELINIGRITDLLTEPSMKEIPSMHIISIVAVDVKNPGLVKTTHPNYEFGPRGKSIGVLEQPIHMKDAFGEAYGSVVSKVAKNEANDKSITPTQALQQGIPVQSGLPNKVYQAAIAKGRLDAVDKLAGFVRQVFPKTTFFTSKEAWETIMADPSVKKQMKDGDVVYGITADGQVYLNPNLKNTKVLLHESGHIWEDFVKENNPKLWEKGESLVSNTKELAEAQKMYGDTPRARSEAIMEIMSTKGDTIVNAAQKADFKEWMVGLWKYISDKFSSLLGLSPKEIENLTLDKFVEGMLADILSGKELKAGKHVADTKPSKAEMAENARFSKERVDDVANRPEKVDKSEKEFTLYHSGTNVISGEFRMKGKNNSWGVFLSPKIDYSKVFGDITNIVKVKPKKTLVLLDRDVLKTPFFNIKEAEYKKYIEDGYDSIAWYRNGKLNEFVVLDNSIVKSNESSYGEKLIDKTYKYNAEKIKTVVKGVEDAIGEPSTTERQIAEAERTIDNAAAWLKDKLKVTGLPEGTQKMGMSQEDLIDLVAVAAKKLVTKGIKVNQAIKQAIDALRAGGFLTNMDEKEISKASRRRMSPTYETDMFKVHTLLVDTAKDYIANGGTSRSEFARQMGVKEKNVEQAWDEATGVKTYNKDQIDRRLADISKTAILRGMNVRQRLEEVLANSSNINASIQTFLRNMELYGVVNPVQVKALTSRAAKVKNANQLDKFLEYAEKVFNDANYAKDMADIRSMQEAARRVKHTGNTKAVKEFTSINPERIPENRMDEYMQALDELSGRVPDYSTMQRIYFDVVGQTNKAKDFSNVTTFNKASEIFDNIMSNEIKTVEDYRKLFADINGLKRRLKQLVENDTITMDEFDAIMDNIGKTTADVKNKFAGKIEGLKNELIDEIRSKTFDYKAQNKEEQQIIDAFKEQTDKDLRRLEPEDLWEMNELIDRANDGNFDYFRWNGVVAEAEKMRRGELVGEQLKGAKRLDKAEAERKLAKQESTFIEGTLGLGRSQAGAVSKYIVSEVERAAGSYNVGIKDGLNALMKAKGNLDKESMHKIGMVVTYLQEYMAQYNPKWSKTQDIGTRDWFGDMLSNPDAMDAYASEKVAMGILRGGEKTKAEVIQKIYDSLPKDANGKVDPKAVYESIMSKDGRFLNSKEQAMLDTMMEYIDANIQPKQEASNFSRGMDFEALSFYMPRIDLTDKMDIEAKVDMSRNRVRVKSGFGEERKSQEVRPIEVDFEVAITRAIEAANRDYYFGKALDMVNGTLGYAAKAGGSSKNLATIIATNVKDMMEFEFARKQSDAAATVGGLLLSARAAQTLLDPIRTVMVELPATFIQVPLRAKNITGYAEIINPTNGKLFQDLLEFTESPLRLRENISRAIDIDQGAIKPQAMKDKALAFLAGAPERITMIGSWMPTFKNEFKRITGETFDARKFQMDPNYRKKYSRAIKEAATSADMTTQKTIGVTTKLSQARELEIPFSKKGPSKDEFWGKTLGFFGNYPRREYLEFVNGFKEIGERYRAGEGVSSLGSISKPLSVAIGTFTYGYMASLAYALKQYYFGTEDEKKKANEALERMSSREGVAEEAIAQSISLAGSKYYSVGRFLTSGMVLVAYNFEEDPEAKKQIARLYKNAFYGDPIDPDGSKTFNSKDNKEKMAMHLVRFIPQLSLAVDKFQQGLEAYGGYEKLMDRYDSLGFEGLTQDEKSLWLLGDIILKAGGIVANVYGTAIPMEKTLQMYVRGKVDVAPMSKADVEEIMKRRIDTRIKTPEERKESYEKRIERRKREMELRKLSKEYGVRYVRER